jgi:hypothetical protein
MSHEVLKQSTQILKHRRRAFLAQSGRCYYCDLPMWKEYKRRFALAYRITLDQAKPFRCTAEHLKAKQEGGDDSQENIVAACHYCNYMRHVGGEGLCPACYRELVQEELRAGRWHDPEVCRKLLKLKPPTTPALRATPPQAGGEVLSRF